MDILVKEGLLFLQGVKFGKVRIYFNTPKIVFWMIEGETKKGRNPCSRH